MINTILTDILRTFSVEELKKFGEMIRSPYFNKQTPLINLFDQIKKYYPDFKNPALKREIIYSKMFPDKKFNYGSMKNLIYELQELAERFIAMEEINKNKFEVKRSLIKSLRNRTLIDLSRKNLRELEKEISGKEISDDEYFLKLNFLNKINHGHQVELSKGNFNLTSKTKEPYFELLLDSSRNLKKYYLLDTLRMYNRIITNKNIVDTDQTLKECKLFISLYKEEDFEDMSLKLEINFLKMNLGSITEEEFLKFKKFVLTDLYEMKAHREIIYAYSIYLLNYCRIKNKTDKQYKAYAFEVVKSLVDNDNFESGSLYIDIVLIRNFVIIATQLNEFQWFEKFLESSINKIHPDDRNNLMNFYYAHKYFYIGKFEKSLEYLSLLNFDDIFNKNYIKELQIFNFYELKYFDLLNEQLESYKKFLTNNPNIPESYRKQCIKFVQYVNELFRAASDKKVDISYFRKKILNENDLMFRGWFLNKLEEIEQ